ncbi:helix-turn-helix domain-containing protein [Proteiniclasticum sp.]|uniref:TetR/AcrR family transcriptional regulator n=1 Tax=Proteiniclasticum sp. TaxID=2053595 RepID=UPI0028A07B37|nr:helix-turn-helix domain-containing protein [Proteiniclasticum sp.]
MDDQIQYSPKQILIFEGVMNLLQEGRPIHELKVAEIAEASGMGKSTAYEYFSSKEEIIREALAYHMRENFRRMVQFVFEAKTFEDILMNALDYLEESLEKRFTGIFLLMLSEHQGKTDKGHYMDPLMKSKIDQVTLKELDKVLLIGKREGSISEEITLDDLKMIVLGFFSAYVHELLPLKSIHCGVERNEKPENSDEEIKSLKRRTVRLMLKTLF